MKIAIITDVHGNYPALQTAISQIDHAGDIERIYCLGDMIGIGPDTNEVLELLTARNDVSFVTGNHELAVLHILDGNGCLEGHESAFEHHKWIADRLDSRFLPFLRALPLQQTMRMEGVTMLLTHYHLQADGRYRMIDPDPSGEKLDSLYDAAPYKLVCFGHHHPLHHFRTNERTYLNPGALGCNDKPLTRYGIVTVVSGEAVVEVKEVEYDNRAFLRSYYKLDVPDKEFIFKVFHGIQRADR
ncbi:metallophosphoesterase family protein [Paenibacillus mesophilus]|nr:metallophosphoesterase family protein [Paenibacillus mesophilus]